MAIYHLSVKTISRKDNVSASARHAYIMREGRYKSDRAEVVYSVEGNMPAWAKGRERKFWQAADRFERKNGRLFRQIEWALPRELSLEEQIETAQALAQEVTTAAGPLPYSLAIHAGHGRGNPHAHMIFSERVNDGAERGPRQWFGRAGKRVGGATGGAKKSRETKRTEWLLWVRKEWEVIANHALAEAGFDCRIDCRTLRAQGIDREPQKHMGPTRAAVMRKLQEAEAQLDAERIQREEAQAQRDAEEIAELSFAPSPASPEREVEEEEADGLFFDAFEVADLAAQDEESTEDDEWQGLSPFPDKKG